MSCQKGLKCLHQLRLCIGCSQIGGDYAVCAEALSRIGTTYHVTVCNACVSKIPNLTTLLPETICIHTGCEANIEELVTKLVESRQRIAQEEEKKKKEADDRWLQTLKRQEEMRSEEEEQRVKKEEQRKKEEDQKRVEAEKQWKGQLCRKYVCQKCRDYFFLPPSQGVGVQYRVPTNLGSVRTVVVPENVACKLGLGWKQISCPRCNAPMNFPVIWNDCNPNASRIYRLVYAVFLNEDGAMMQYFFENEPGFDQCCTGRYQGSYDDYNSLEPEIVTYTLYPAVPQEITDILKKQ